MSHYVNVDRRFTGEQLDLAYADVLAEAYRQLQTDMRRAAGDMTPDSPLVATLTLTRRYRSAA